MLFIAPNTSNNCEKLKLVTISKRTAAVTAIQWSLISKAFFSEKLPW